VAVARYGVAQSITELLASPETSVVTLVGPEGTGKTSLVAPLGAEVLSSFADGVFFVDLSALTDPALVIPALAQALSLRETLGARSHRASPSTSRPERCFSSWTTSSRSWRPAHTPIARSPLTSGPASFLVAEHALERSTYVSTARRSLRMKMMRCVASVNTPPSTMQAKLRPSCPPAPRS
jgi:Cdc6-like AAA superfamily ATPase